ncbi:unnamed protein product [Rotaria sordida]|uniref:Uncharacterized protein n=1 Tax=Rotaria sordida TaxID=392033 RepID=A0A815D7G0_9BILA|nr:unnamed protein product [Rotaria sordida]CAF1566399.1 unnamed protein product [Rotaria sordida]
MKYGGMTYQLERGNHIRKECLKKNVPGILHRLWPTLIYASTAIGSTFAIYKKEIQFYCGTELPLINHIRYAASEGFFGISASIHTDEYFLLPTCVFFEFIKEEDIDQSQPKTLLISEIKPGNRYELVCTNEAGLIRYRMGDVINCTRFLNRADDLIPLPSEPEEIPRIPLISIAYRTGNLLDIYGEKTCEQHIMNAIKLVVNRWKEQGIHVDICDFTSYTKVDVSPAHYIIFLELMDVQGNKIDDQQLRMLQNNVSLEVDQQLHITNDYYKQYRSLGKLGSLLCIIVRSGTFAEFFNRVLATDRVSPVQNKPRRLLNNEKHIQFFYDNQITTFDS